MDKLKKSYIKISIFVILIIIFFIGLFISSNFIKPNNILTNYIYTGNINYNVILNDGSKSNQKLYVSSLVDNIEINFNYKYNLKNYENVKYRYEIISSVISNLDDSTKEITEVYREDQQLLKTDYKNLNSDNIKIDESLKLNYDNYNIIASNYNKSVNIAVKSKLMVKLILYVNYGSKEEKYSSYLSLPLEQNTFSININNSNASGLIYGTDSNSLKILIDLVLAISIIVLLILVIYNLVKLFQYKNQHLLEFKYRKIMQDYNNVVVEIPEIPNDKSITLIRVLYFKSMIDIQKELHVPILCYKQKDYIVYLIINDRLAYVYFLNNNKEKI